MSLPRSSRLVGLTVALLTAFALGCGSDAQTGLSTDQVLTSFQKKTGLVLETDPSTSGGRIDYLGGGREAIQEGYGNFDLAVITDKDPSKFKESMEIVTENTVGPDQNGFRWRKVDSPYSDAGYHWTAIKVYEGNVVLQFDPSDAEGGPDYDITGTPLERVDEVLRKIRD